MIKYKYISPLTTRILAVNIGALLILAFGLLFTGQYEKEMIGNARTALLAQGRLLSVALTSSGRNTHIPVEEQLAPLLRKLSESNALHIVLFDKQGALITARPHIETEEESTPALRPLPRKIISALRGFMSARLDLPLYPQPYPDIRSALSGAETADAWRDEAGHIKLTALLPMPNPKSPIGAIMVQRSGRTIEDAVRDMQLTVIKLFLGALLSTILLSIYLTETIGIPLLRLADAAGKVEQSLLLRDAIPDFSYRGDEIGALSGALRSMTAALSERIDAIGNFSADVAHEIKNPLASLKSAVETFVLVRDPERQQKLLAIIEADVDRLDRLITDISTASRLDAEISRAAKTSVDLGALLQNVVQAETENLGLQGRLSLHTEPNKRYIVTGNAAQLEQVMDNLIQNAHSFLSAEGKIAISCVRQKDKIIINVDNDGPPIPENKIETIFERFYSERPESERFGLHSGLGLSISRQIVRSHKGAIFARNILSEKGQHRGVRFTIILPAGAAT